MRRPLSLINAAVLAATSLVALSQSPVSASSAVTVERSATTAPASISGATTMQALRLAQSNQMFVVGANVSTPGSALHLWKVNDDLSMDTSFGAVSLGTSFTLPTAANSNCVANPQPMFTCSYLNGFSVNETADRYAIAFSRQLSGSGNFSITNTITSVALGKISTGEILASVNIGSEQTGMPLSDWSQFNPVAMAKTVCTAVTGATLSGSPLEFTFQRSSSIAIRPDGSIILGTSCEYSNRNVIPTPTSINEYQTSLLYAVKPSSGALVLDTSFGTNGAVVTFNNITKCGFDRGLWTINTALTSNDSPALFSPISVVESPRNTTIPSWISNNYPNVTSYSGCDGGFSPLTSSAKLITMQANGTIKNTLSFPNNMYLVFFRWVIDPQGRWNTTTTTMSSGPSPSQATYFVRLTSNGAFDTTVGASGMKEMTNLPATVTVGGTSVRMGYSISGFATTATGILFTGFASAMNPIPNCMNPSDTTTSLYPFYIALETGLLKTYGTGGLGDAVTLETPSSDMCTSNLARTSFINSKGQHMYFAETRALNAQAAGLMMATWNAATGVTGGGEGGGALGTMGRTDNKVYARKLPTTTQEGTVLKVLTNKTSRTQMLRSITPKICVALSKSVVLVDEGRCRIQVVNKTNRRVVRSLSTRVRSGDVAVGTTVEVEDAIMFARVSRRLSKSARAQVAELAKSATTAKRIILVGHTATLTNATASNNFISLHRAAAVKDALRAEFKKAGVNVPISIASLGSRAPLTTSTSERAQARNRRVDVYVMP